MHNNVIIIIISLSIRELSGSRTSAAEELPRAVCSVYTDLIGVVLCLRHLSVGRMH